MKIKVYKFLLGLALAFVLASCKNNFDAGHELKQLYKFELKNGITVLLLPRKHTTLVSTHIRFLVGSADEEESEKGLAHVLEHMAFKGTPEIGTLNPEQDKIFLQNIQEVSQKRLLAFNQSDTKAIASISEEIKTLEEQHQAVMVQNEFYNILRSEGANPLSATTTYDFTNYFSTIPSHALELWAYLESERLKQPFVMRDFFKELEVVKSERQQRINENVDGLMMEAFLKLAYPQKPYGHLALGDFTDLEQHTPQKAIDFFNKFYTPERMVVVLVGDFEIDDAKHLIKKYFETLPPKDTYFKKIDFSVSSESANYPRKLVFEAPFSERFWLGFKRDALPHPDDVVFDFIKSYLCDGENAFLKQKLVHQKKMALSITCDTAVPGQRFENHFVFVGMPAKGFTSEEVILALKKEIESLMHEGLPALVLKDHKTKMKAQFVYSLSKSASMASKLSFFELMTGEATYMQDQAQALQNLSLRRLKNTLKNYFRPHREVLVVQKQQKEEL